MELHLLMKAWHWNETINKHRAALIYFHSGKLLKRFTLIRLDEQILLIYFMKKHATVLVRSSMLGQKTRTVEAARLFVPAACRTNRLARQTMLGMSGKLLSTSLPAPK